MLIFKLVSLVLESAGKPCKGEVGLHAPIVYHCSADCSCGLCMLLATPGRIKLLPQIIFLRCLFLDHQS